MAEISIERPWVIAHQLPSNKLEVILSGPEDATVGAFSIVAADIIRHIARHFDVDEHDVLRWVDREIANPTSNITGGAPS